MYMFVRVCFLGYICQVYAQNINVCSSLWAVLGDVCFGWSAWGGLGHKIALRPMLGMGHVGRESEGTAPKATKSSAPHQNTAFQ